MTEDREFYVSRILVSLVKQAGGVVRLPLRDMEKANSGDSVTVDMYEDELVLTLDVDEVLQRRVDEAVYLTRELIYELEIENNEH